MNFYKKKEKKKNKKYLKIKYEIINNIIFYFYIFKYILADHLLLFIKALYNYLIKNKIKIIN